MTASPSLADVVFVASGSAILALRVHEASQSFDRSSAVSGRSAGLPDPAESLSAEIMHTLPAAGEVRGLHAAGPFVFWADNNGLSCIDVRASGITAAAASKAPVKVVKLACANKALQSALRGRKLSEIKTIHAIALSDAQESIGQLKNYVLLVSIAGEIVAVEADALTTSGLCSLDLGLATVNRVVYAKSAHTLFAVEAAADALWQATLNLPELLSCLQASKAAAASRATPPSKSARGGSKGSAKTAAASEVHRSITSLDVTASRVCDWPSPAAATAVDIALTHTGALLLTKSAPTFGVVCVLGDAAFSAHPTDASTPIDSRAHASFGEFGFPSPAVLTETGESKQMPSQLWSARVRPTHDNFIEALFAAAAAREEIRYLMVCVV